MKDELTRHVDHYLEMAAVERGLSANTLEAYSRDLNRLADFLAKRHVSGWDGATRLGTARLHRGSARLPA